MRAKSPNRRGSPEAIARRVVARRLNDLLTHGEGPAAVEDGRTARRRRRLLDALARGTERPDGMKPIEILQAVDTLLGLGETVASLKKVVTLHARPALRPETAAALVAALASAYQFRLEAYAFVGLPPPAAAPRRPHRGSTTDA
ncbi:MAG: hypothetical protein JNK72_10255 [Myxococcales bacterium]|nr:hypothetical protein [Myxococcales bacterium]